MTQDELLRELHHHRKQQVQDKKAEILGKGCVGFLVLLLYILGIAWLALEIWGKLQ